MSINIISKIKPKNNGSFPVFEDRDIFGGYQIREDITDRNAIPLLNRKEGMLVYSKFDDKYYTLSGGLSDGYWAEVVFGGSSQDFTLVNTGIDYTVPSGENQFVFIESVNLTPPESFITITLPSNPTNNQEVIIKDGYGTLEWIWGVGGVGLKIDGNGNNLINLYIGSTFQIANPFTCIHLRFCEANSFWNLVSEYYENPFDSEVFIFTLPVYSHSTTKRWYLNLTEGAAYVFDWGDGTMDSYIGNGSLQTQTHIYTAEGIYQVRLYITNPLALTEFRCSALQLLGELPSFAKCVNLVNFNCKINHLSGTLPSFAPCVNLQNFLFSQNNFSGEMPSFETCTNLIYFRGEINQFSGELPSFSGENLIDFAIYENQFSGTLPSFVGCPNLEYFICTLNQFSGTLPSFATCTNLINFYCDGNQFSGTLPSFASCSNLLDFQIHGNQFSGTLPSFDGCANLEYFYCYDNQFSGMLPSFDGCNLGYFYCFNNQFSGTLPSFDTTNLKNFQIHNNQFSGTLPSFTMPTYLRYFDCSLNQFSGTLPSFSSFMYLTDFYCYENQFNNIISGVIPTPCSTWQGQTNLFSTTDVDTILANYETNVTARPTYGEINLTFNAAPSAAGLASKDAILAARPEWDITHA